MTASEIAYHRRNLGMSQADFAAVIGVHPITVSKWERGQGSPDAYRAALIESLRPRWDHRTLIDRLGPIVALKAMLATESVPYQKR